MEYKLAIEKLLTTHGLEVMNHPFLALSILSDYVGSDIYSTRLIEVLFTIYPSIDIIELFRKRSIKDGREELKQAFPSFKDKMSAKEYCDAINPISKFMRPNEFTTSQSTKPVVAKANAVAVRHRAVKPAKPSKPTVQPAPRITPAQFQNLVNNRVNQAMQGTGLQQYLPKPKPKAKRTTKKSFLHFLICATCKSFKCVPTSGAFRVFVDGVLDQAETKSAFIVSGILSSIINKPNSEITIHIPDADYKAGTFTINGANCVMIGDANAKISCKTMDIKNEKGYLYLGIDCQDLNIDQGKGNIYYSGSVQTLTTTQACGNAQWLARTSTYSNITINWDNKRGGIQGMFVEGSLQPMPATRLLGITNLVTSGHVNKSKVNLNLKCKYGKIKLT